MTIASVYSLALRIGRICSIEEANEQFEILAENFRKREYSEEVIQEGIQSTKQVSREEALKKVEKKKDNEREGRETTQTCGRI